jgi:hypothetical protein
LKTRSSIYVKSLITIFTLLTCIPAYSQNRFKAQLYVENSLPVSGGLIIFPLTGDTVDIPTSDNIAIVDLNFPERRLFYFSWLDLTSKVFRFDTNVVDDNIQKVNLTDTIFYRQFQAKHICPICLHSKYLIPVVYGMPSKKQFMLAQKGKIQLGGCNYNIGKKYYCKKDAFEF